MRNIKVFIFCLLGVVLLSEGMAQLWFTAKSAEFAGLDSVEGVRRVSLVDERANDLLSFDEGSNYFSDRGGDVTLTVMTWQEGNSHGLTDAFGHSPEVCLPVSGAKLLEAFPLRDLKVEQQVFQVQSWMFSHPLFPENIHAFKLAHSSDPSLVEMALNKQMVEARLMLFQNRRLMPVIEVGIGVVKGTDNPDLAWDRFSAFVTENFKLKPLSTK